MRGAWRYDLEAALFPISAAATFGGLWWLVFAHAPLIDLRPAPPVFEPAPQTTEPNRLNDAPRSSARTLTIALDDGQFRVPIRLGKTTASAVVDTGAGTTEVVLLVEKDIAREAGIPVDSLSFDQAIFGIGGGKTWEAHARVAYLRVGDFVVHNAPIGVLDSHTGAPALITTLFLRHYKVALNNGNTMTISEP